MIENYDELFKKHYHLTSAIARLQVARETVHDAIKYARPIDEIEPLLQECLQQIRHVEMRLSKNLLLDRKDNE